MNITPGPDEFAELVIDELKELGEENPIFFDRERFELIVKDGIGRPVKTMSLNKIYEKYLQAERSEKDHILTSYLAVFSSAAEIPINFEDARPNLLLRIQDRWAVQFMNDRFKSGKIGNPAVAIRTYVPHKVIADVFAVTLAYDMPESIALLNNVQLEEWNIGFDEAYHIAYQNLRARSNGEFYVLQTGLLVAAYEDGYDTSRVLIPDVAEELPVKGDAVAFIIDDNTIAFTGSLDEEGLATAAEMVSDRQQSASAMPPVPILMHEGILSRFDFSENSPVGLDLAMLELNYWKRVYDDQEEELASSFESVVNDAVAVSFLIVEHEDPEEGVAEPLSICFAVDGTNMLLPQSDLVAFSRMDGEEQIPIGVTFWDRLTEVFGDKLSVATEFPPRYKLELKLNPELLEKLELTPMDD